MSGERYHRTEPLGGKRLKRLLAAELVEVNG